MVAVPKLTKGPPACCGKIVGTELPYLDHLCTTCCVKKATKTLQTSICSSFAHQAGTSEVYKHANRLKRILTHRKTKSPFTKQDKLEWVKTVQRSSWMSPPFCTSSWRCISLFFPFHFSELQIWKYWWKLHLFKCLMSLLFTFFFYLDRQKYPPK